MGKTYSCTFANCDKVFSKVYELKKHKATHDDPDSVFYCSECDFITLQKKSLGIHFSIHTGEKMHACPDMISFVSTSGLPAREERCEYRTNDPAALTKHRKNVHGYVPPPNRSRPAKAVSATPRKPVQRMDEKGSRRRRRPQRLAPVSRRRLPRLPRKSNVPSSGPGYTLTPTEPAQNATPLLHQGDVYGDAVDVDRYEGSGYDFSGATLVGSDEGLGLDTLYDPSLRSQWMAKYEEGYSTFDATGMKHLPEPLHAVLSTPASLDMQTSREGCLCPEWMVEPGIEGWDQSVLETHKECYVLDA